MCLVLHLQTCHSAVGDLRPSQMHHRQEGQEAIEGGGLKDAPCSFSMDRPDKMTTSGYAVRLSSPFRVPRPPETSHLDKDRLPPQLTPGDTVLR